MLVQEDNIQSKLYVFTKACYHIMKPRCRTVSGHKEVISYVGNGVIFVMEITPLFYFHAPMPFSWISAINEDRSSSVGRSIIPTAVK